MANASLNEIYNRMHSVANYHPFTADTYADWSLEAGDIVTVERNGVQSASPVHTTTVRWNGRQRVTLESRGEKERESVAKMSAKAFNSGGNSGGGYRSGYRGRKKTDEDVADLWVESGRIYGYAQNVEGTLKGEISLTKSEFDVKLSNLDTKLTGEIKVQAGRIDIFVTKDGKVKAGVIVDAINEDSSVQISADRIVLSGNTTINDIFNVTNDVIYAKKPMIIGPRMTDSVYLGSDGRIVAETIEVRGSAGHNYPLTVSDITVSGNTLTIVYADGRKSVNFSKAVTLEGAWNGSRKFTVDAYQTNGGKRTKVKSFSTTVVGSIAASDFTDWDEYWGTADLYALIGTSEIPRRIGSVLVNAKAAYDAGAESVTPEQHTNNITLVYDHTETSSSGGMTLFTHFYKHTMNSNTRPLGDMKTVWW